MRRLPTSALTLVPIYVAAAIVVVVILGLFLIVVRDGRYAENLLRKGVRIRPLRRWMIQSYLRELEKSNPGRSACLLKDEACHRRARAQAHRARLFPCCQRRNVALIWSCSMTGTPTG